MAKIVGKIIECWMQSIYKLSTIESIIAVWMLVGAYATEVALVVFLITGSKFSLLQSQRQLASMLLISAMSLNTFLSPSIFQLKLSQLLRSRHR